MINFCENITKFEILYNSFKQMNCKTEIEKYLLHTIYSSNQKSTWKTVDVKLIIDAPPKWDLIIVLSNYDFFQYCDNNIGL